MIGDNLIKSTMEGRITHSMAMEQFINAIVQAALKHHDGNITHAGESLGIGRTTLSMMLKNDRPYVKCFRQKR
jgi:DNA-binding NtrC family response regulator